MDFLLRNLYATLSQICRPLSVPSFICTSGKVILSFKQACFPPGSIYSLFVEFIFLAQQEKEHLTINLSQKFCQHVDRCRRVFRKKEICKCILWSKETIKYTFRRGMKMFTRKRLGTSDKRKFRIISRRMIYCPKFPVHLFFLLDILGQ